VSIVLNLIVLVKILEDGVQNFLNDITCFYVPTVADSSRESFVEDRN
jgi:hypothetical protein